MRFGLSLPPFGDHYGDVHYLARMAREAEEAGWDAFFIWDHMIFDPSFYVIPDTWVALAAIAMNTQRIRIGAMVTPLPRRRPWKLARETVSVDRLSNGRLTVGVGLGDPVQWDYGFFGEEQDAKLRARKLDEGLDILAGLWSAEPFSYDGEHYHLEQMRFRPAPVQQPRIPIWVAGGWPNKKPMRRASRFDGVFPLTHYAGVAGMVTVADMRAAIDFVAGQRGNRAFDVAHAGRSTGNPAEDRALLEPFAEVGVTWWLENANPWAFGWSGQGEWPVEAIRTRILQGPPRG